MRPEIKGQIWVFDAGRETVIKAWVISRLQSWTTTTLSQNVHLNLLKSSYLKGKWSVNRDSHPWLHVRIIDAWTSYQLNYVRTSGAWALVFFIAHDDFTVYPGWGKTTGLGRDYWWGMHGLGCEEMETEMPGPSMTREHTSMAKFYIILKSCLQKHHLLWFESWISPKGSCVPFLVTKVMLLEDVETFKRQGLVGGLQLTGCMPSKRTVGPLPLSLPLFHFLLGEFCSTTHFCHVLSQTQA